MINLESHLYSTLRAVVKLLLVRYAYIATYDIYIKKFYHKRFISLMWSCFQWFTVSAILEFFVHIVADTFSGLLFIIIHSLGF